MSRTPEQSVTTASKTAEIRRCEGVLGGAACIRDTRIPVSVLVDLRAQGRSDEQLLGDFPGLSRADLDAAWAYYRDHQAEIDQSIVDANCPDLAKRIDQAVAGQNPAGS
jgi:uncharacterized protein (DUF433 family)